MNFYRKRSILVVATFMLRLLGQGLAFFIFARVLGSSEFGIVVATLAIASPISPLIDLGVYSIISRDIALGLPPQKIINENISTMLVSVPIGLVLIMLTSFFINNDSNFYVTFKIALAYILISRVSQIMAAIQNSIDREIPIIAVELLSAILLVSLGIYGMFFEYDLAIWSNFYIMISIIVLLATLFLINNYIGKIVLNLNISMSRIKEGLVFSTGNSAQYIYTDIDKLYVFKFLSSSLAGVYGIAGRISSFILVPIGSIYSIYFPQFMIAGKENNNNLQKLIVKVLRISIYYSLFVIIITFLVAGYIPYFLGEDYSKVPILIKALLIPIVLQIMQVPLADALTGLGYQKYRTAAQVFAAILALVGGWLLIPVMGIMGAILVSGAIHIFLLVFYIYFVVKLIKDRDTI